MSVERTADQWFTATSYEMRVEPCLVSKHTKSFVWVGGRRRNRLSSWRSWFPTEKEAWDWLEERKSEEAIRSQEAADHARSHLAEVLHLRSKAGV